MRKFILYIDEFEYGVYEKGYNIWVDDEYTDYKRLKKYCFADIRVKNNKILGFFDIPGMDKAIKAAKKDEAMAEICEFEVLFHDKFKEFIKCSFTEALEYIDNQFNIIFEEEKRAKYKK